MLARLCCVVRSDFTSGDFLYFVTRNIVLINYCAELKHMVTEI